MSARGTLALSEGWSATVRGTVGGFGVGADSEWGVYGGVTYQQSDRLSFTAGYRHLAVDYESGTTLFDVALSGPVLGLTYRF